VSRCGWHVYRLALPAVLCYTMGKSNPDPMLKTSACLFFVGAASTAALPIACGLAAAGAVCLWADHNRAA
jgi:hypothetical protein